MSLAIDKFKHHLTTRSIADAIMNHRIGFQAYHPDILQAFFYFVDGGKLRQHPLIQLQIADAALAAVAAVSLITAITRKEEQTAFQAGFVDAFGNEFLLHHRQSQHTILGGKFQAFFASGSERKEFLSARNNHVFAVQIVLRVFDGTGKDDASVLGFQGDACAGKSRRYEDR